ncbi:MAG: hypothetical protein R3F62_09390 [Planctomycetota bacterium]
MTDQDPYRAPQIDEPPPDFPATACPACKAEITLWVSIRQFNPYRFRCLRCRETFDVHTPHLAAIVAVGVAIGVLLVGGSAVVLDWLGLSVAWSLLAFLAFCGVLLLWSHSYGQQHCRLSRLR